jgi:AcrR family transcriptional regulator
MPNDTFFNLPAEKRQRITEVALREFANKPYNQVSVSGIARQADIAKGSLYQYFENKKELFFYLVHLASQLKLDFLKKQREDIDWSDFFDGYRELLVQSTNFEIENPLYSKLLEQAVSSPHIDELFSETKKEAAGFMQPLLEQSLQSGQLRTDIPADMLAFFFNTVTAQFGEFLAYKAGFQDWTDVLYEDNREAVLSLELSQHINNLIKLLRNGMATKNAEDRQAGK